MLSSFYDVISCCNKIVGLSLACLSTGICFSCLATRRTWYSEHKFTMCLATTDETKMWKAPSSMCILSNLLLLHFQPCPTCFFFSFLCFALLLCAGWRVVWLLGWLVCGNSATSIVYCGPLSPGLLKDFNSMDQQSLSVWCLSSHWYLS